MHMYIMHGVAEGLAGDWLFVVKGFPILALICPSLFL